MEQQIILGHVRDYFPRVTLTLPGVQGPVSVEFIVDTAFDGDLSLPNSLIARLDVEFATERLLQMVDGTIIKRYAYLIDLDCNQGTRPTEIMALENAPLLGAVLMDESHVDLDMRSGGEVSIEPY